MGSENWGCKIYNKVSVQTFVKSLSGEVDDCLRCCVDTELNCPSLLQCIGKEGEKRQGGKMNRSLVFWSI